MKCPKCSHEWTPDSSELAAEFGRRTSTAKARAARRNAKLGGWPKGKKRGKRKPDANQIAHGVVAKAERLTRQGRVPPKLKVLPSSYSAHPFTLIPE